MAATDDGRLFFGDLEASGVRGWNISEPLNTSVLVTYDSQTQQWPGPLPFLLSSFCFCYSFPANTAKFLLASLSLSGDVLPDTFAFDGHGNLLFVSNKLELYIFGGMQFDGSDGLLLSSTFFFLEG
jgi:hypothetical protein